MKVKVKRMHDLSVVRFETAAEIKEVLINDDLLHPEAEVISVCFRGDHSSGIIEFTPDEVEKLMNTVKIRMNLIKGMKRMKA